MPSLSDQWKRIALWLLKNRLRSEAVRKNHRKSASCCGGCVMRIIGIGRWRFKERPENVIFGCKKRSGGFTGYQRCESSVILLLEDNSHEHYTTKYPLMAKPVCYQLTIEWRLIQATAKFLQLSWFPPSIVRCWNGSSVSIEIKFHHSFMILDWWYHMFDLDQIFWSARNRIEHLSS